MPSERSPESAVVEALGTSWTVHSLYPDPESQPAFRRAVEALRSLLTESVSLQVGVEGFAVEGEPVDVDREGADRLARRCYVHNVELLRLISPPAERDVVRLFEVLARDEESVRASGGVEAALLRNGVDSFAVVQRALLRAAGEEAEPQERDPHVEEVLVEGADPKQFAQSLLDEANRDPETLASLFRDRYHEVLARVEEDDVTGREEVVKAFVEAFFYFPDEHQVSTFRGLLLGDTPPDRVFLDQFAGHELARLAPKLDPRGLGLLLDYARLATDQADSRPEELMALLQSPEAVQSAREVVAAKVQERVGTIDEIAAEEGTFDEFAARHPDARRFFYDTLEVFRALLEVEDRDPRFLRLLRIWSGKIGSAVRRREYRRAELWLRALTDNPTFVGERGGDVDEAITQLASSEMMSQIVSAATEAKEPGPAVRLLQSLGPRAVNVLVDLLSEADEPARRRTLIDVLAQVADRSPEPVVERMRDPRWYVVRNLVLVLGKTRRADVAPALERAFGHGDHRVRVEALRALAAVHHPGLQRLVARALRDPHELVRHSAIGILGVQGSPESERMLIGALTGGKADLGEKQRIVKLLGESQSASSRDTLEKLARRRFLLFPGARALRDAARSALKRSPA